MAKKRQSIRDIQEALGNNTKYIRASQETEEPNIQLEEDKTSVEDHPCAFVITSENAESLRLLAQYQQTTPEALINMAIEDLLALRYRQLQAAKEKSAKGIKD